MMVDLCSQIFQLPSGQRFLSGVLGDLSRRCSVVVLLPAGVDPLAVSRVIQEEIRRCDYYLEEIPLPELPFDNSPAVALSTRLELQWEKDDTSRTVTNLLLSDNLPEIIFFRGFADLNIDQRKKWLKFIVDWSLASQHATDNGREPAACCLFIPAAELPTQAPAGNVYLSVRWWWGFPTSLEVQLLCRFGELELNEDIESWREYLLPSVVGNDVFLAEYLWDKLEGNVDNLISHLQSYAAQHSWTGEEIKKLGVDNISFSANKDKKFTTPDLLEWHKLWSRGLLSWTPEYGLELHPAALVVLGRRDELGHRLWRGQSNLLLPLIDGIRLKICGNLTLRYGNDWPVKWIEPIHQEEENEVRNSPLACQWGHLEYLLKNCQHLRDERRWLSVVKPARKIRNELAHYRPVGFADYRQLYYEWQRFKSLEENRKHRFV